MNKLTVGIISFLVGAAAGTGTTYILTKRHMENVMDEELQAAHDRYREKLKESGVVEEDEEEASEEESDDDEEAHPHTDDEKIDRNAGVKKYWRGVEKDDLDETFHEVAKEVKDVSENERAAELDPTLDDVPGIEIIPEEEYTTDQGYEKVSLQYFCGDDVLRLLNPDGTTGSDADIWFRTEKNADVREEVIGKYMRWAPDYIEPGNSNGYLYVKNENLKMEFEIEILDDYFQDEEDIQIGQNGEVVD